MGVLPSGCEIPLSGGGQPAADPCEGHGSGLVL